GATTVRTEPIQRRYAEGGGVVAVAAAARTGLGQFEAEVAGEPLCQLRQARDSRAPLHRWPIDAAADGQLGAVDRRSQPTDGGDDPLGFRGAGEANVDLRPGLGGHHVGSGAAAYHADVD